VNKGPPSLAPPELPELPLLPEDPEEPEDDVLANPVGAAWTPQPGAIAAQNATAR
jgi:hypothetical protein